MIDHQPFELPSIIMASPLPGEMSKEVISPSPISIRNVKTQYQNTNFLPPELKSTMRVEMRVGVREDIS